MPELPEVETVRRMLESTVVGRSVRRVRLSGLRLRAAIPRTLPRRLAGRRLRAVERRGKYLLIRFDQGLTLLSHLGMSGRWLFHPLPPGAPLRHVHARLEFTDGSELHFQDARRFGLLQLLPDARLEHDPALARLGPDPLASPPTADMLRVLARGLRSSVKSFLLDQRRIAGIGNIYASEILFRARIDPRRHAGRLSHAEWETVARETSLVLAEAIGRMGTTLNSYRTPWNEPGAYGEMLRVYDRAGEPCRRCGRPLRRIVQAQRSTFFCPFCQGGRRRARRAAPSAGARGSGAATGREGRGGWSGARRKHP